MNNDFIVENFNLFAVKHGATIYNRTGHKLSLKSYCEDCIESSRLSILNLVTKELLIYSEQGLLIDDAKNGLVYGESKNDLVVRSVIVTGFSNAFLFISDELRLLTIDTHDNSIQNNVFDTIEDASKFTKSTNELPENIKKGIVRAEFKHYL
jgi:hypothetical protein